MARTNISSAIFIFVWASEHLGQMFGDVRHLVEVGYRHLTPLRTREVLPDIQVPDEFVDLLAVQLHGDGRCLSHVL